MGIGAYNKINQTMVDICSNFLSDRVEITDRNEIEMRFEKGIGSGGYGKWFLSSHEDATVQAYEYASSDGLILLDSKISYFNQVGNFRTIRQLTLTSDYNHEPLINISMERKLKNYAQMITNLETKDDVYETCEKDIAIDEVSVSVGGTCHSIFREYTDLHSNQIIKEEYRQGYPILNRYLNPFINQCGCFLKTLEVLYRINKEQECIPVFGQFMKDSRVEEIGYDSSSSDDVLKMIEIINMEVDAITKKMYQVVEKYRNQEKPKEKKITN